MFLFLFSSQSSVKNNNKKSSENEGDEPKALLITDWCWIFLFFEQNQSY